MYVRCRDVFVSGELIEGASEQLDGGFRVVPGDDSAVVDVCLELPVPQVDRGRGFAWDGQFELDEIFVAVFYVS